MNGNQRSYSELFIENIKQNFGTYNKGLSDINSNVFEDYVSSHIGTWIRGLMKVPSNLYPNPSDDVQLVATTLGKSFHINVLLWNKYSYNKPNVDKQTIYSNKHIMDRNDLSTLHV